MQTAREKAKHVHQATLARPSYVPPKPVHRAPDPAQSVTPDVRRAEPDSKPALPDADLVAERAKRKAEPVATRAGRIAEKATGQVRLAPERLETPAVTPLPAARQPVTKPAAVEAAAGRLARTPAITRTPTNLATEGSGPLISVPVLESRSAGPVPELSAPSADHSSADHSSRVLPAVVPDDVAGFSHGFFLVRAATGAAFETTYDALSSSISSLYRVGEGLLAEAAAVGASAARQMPEPLAPGGDAPVGTGGPGGLEAPGAGGAGVVAALALLLFLLRAGGSLTWLSCRILGPSSGLITVTERPG